MSNSKEISEEIQVYNGVGEDTDTMTFKKQHDNSNDRIQFCEQFLDQSFQSDHHHVPVDEESVHPDDSRSICETSIIYMNDEDDGDENEDDYDDNDDDDGDDCSEDYYDDDDDCCNSHSDVFLLTKPIIVGYAFGPKKMSTMGVVMAEASKTRLSATPSSELGDMSGDNDRKIEIDLNLLNYQNTKSCRSKSRMIQAELTSNRNTTQDKTDDNSLTKWHKSCDKINTTAMENASLDSLKGPHCFNNVIDHAECVDDIHTSPFEGAETKEDLLDCMKVQRKRRQRDRRVQIPRTVDDECVTFTIDGRMVNYSSGQPDNSLVNKNNTFRNIVRRFRSSCSSVASTNDDASSTATGTCTASVASSSQQTTGTTCALASTSSGSRRRYSTSQPKKQFPVRVSFVPLDPDFPLEEQHGGKLDVILHKLTEDILYLSQLAMKDSKLKKSIEDRKLTDIVPSKLQLSSTDEQAVERVLRVSNFHSVNPDRCLVDDPASVLTLMSRADIANTLEWCLRGVSSASGIPVGSPTSAVIAPPFSDHPDDVYQTTDTALIDTSWLHNKVSHLSYPIIVKPLCAAGTKASHAMAVIMNPASLHHVVTEKAPCILQEYINHDAFLYKVYVLGDHVSVHKRRSLPNLPFRSIQSGLDHVEFDSQRPYPRLSDFGYPEDLNDVCAGCSRSHQNDEIHTNKMFPTSENILDDSNKNDTMVTVDEIMPIVNALRVAFGLQLFGFDVLIASNCSCNEKAANTTKRMLVIDVNYFPSYKEVTNFPALLAKYLTDRVLESRKKSIQNLNTK